ncbi:MAG: hypothetical protein DME88_13175 [Verrucomicrobia bacterium]|nr:MAG: hypothetical protein DME88_13175 [Verrucomicrobiota bacterium]
MAEKKKFRSVVEETPQKLRARPRAWQDDLSGRLARLGVQITQTSLSKIENWQRYVMDYEALVLAKFFCASASHGFTVKLIIKNESSRLLVRQRAKSKPL